MKLIKLALVSSLLTAGVYGENYRGYDNLIEYNDLTSKGRTWEEKAYDDYIENKRIESEFKSQSSDEYRQQTQLAVNAIDSLITNSNIKTLNSIAQKQIRNWITKIVNLLLLKARGTPIYPKNVETYLESVAIQHCNALINEYYYRKTDLEISDMCCDYLIYIYQQIENDLYRNERKMRYIEDQGLSNGPWKRIPAGGGM